MQRQPEALKDGTFDLLVLGGGITGAGVALDARLRGLRVALIDRGDFAGATSGVSSKLVHGGLRYLEHGAFRLVHEALRERGRLLRNAPHLVHPLRFIIPFYPEDRVRPWKWRVGLTLYDLLAGRENIQRSRVLARADLLRTCPGLRRDGLRGGAAYFDAQMDDARLTLAVLRSAVNEGAIVANYVEAAAFERREGIIVGVRAVDRVSGRDFTIHARQVLNATGPWVDRVCRLAGDDSGPHLQPTKGVHIVLPDRGYSSAFLLLHPHDGRVLFVIPWMGKTLVGTTDTFGDDRPDDLGVSAAEIAYLLAAYNAYIGPKLGPGDVLGSFAGLRPLIRARPGEPSSLTREYRLFAAPSGLLSVAGGKYTTYRHMAEVITDEVLRRLGLRRPCRTHEFRLEGAPKEPWLEFQASAQALLCKNFHLTESSARHLVERYGTRCAEVATFIKSPELAAPVVPGEPDLRGEFAYQRAHEMAVFPADFLLRRTRLGLWRADLLKEPSIEMLIV